MQFRKLVFLLLIILASHTLSAEIRATYDIEPVLYFGPGTTPFSSYDYVVKLGTLTFTSTSGQLLDPTMIGINTSVNFVFNGMMDQGREEDSVFRLASKFTVNGKTSWVRLDHGNLVNSLTNENGNLNTNPFIAEIYLISDQAANRYVEGEIYEWVSGSFGSFSLVSKQADNTYVGVPVEGSTEPISYLPDGGSIPEPIPYGEPEAQVRYLLSIHHDDAFDISHAYGTKRVQIATAKVLLENAMQSTTTTYGVNVTFRNTLGTQSFMLNHSDASVNFPIPYKLYFGDTLVVGNEMIEWGPLAPVNENTRPILVPDINQSRAEIALEGNYSDTIYIDIMASGNV